MNKSPINVLVQSFCGKCFRLSWAVPRSRIAELLGRCVVNSPRSHEFSKVVVPFYAAIRDVCESCLLHILAND